MCISLKFIILKIKDPWLILINCQTCHFNFFIEWTQFFLFIGPESDHCLPLSLTHSCLVNLISVTLACGDGNSKLVEVVTVVEVGDERHVDNSLVQVWKINFGHKVKFFRILRIRFQGLFKISKLMFRQDLKLYCRCNQGSRLKKQWLHAA